MPTKVIDSEGKPRNWPTDFTSEIKNTIAGSKEEKFDFGNNSIAALASRSAKSTLIEFDNDAFVEEGKTYLEKIENDKILELAKMQNSSPQIYNRLERSRIFDDVKDYTLLDMQDSAKRQKIVGYTLYGKTLPEDYEFELGELSEEEIEAGKTTDDKLEEAIDDYYSQFKDVPQRGEYGSDVPSLPLHAMSNPKEKDIIGVIKIVSKADNSGIEITSRNRTGDKSSDFFVFEYNNKDDKERHLKRLYPNVSFRSSAKTIPKGEQRVELVKGQFELTGDPILEGIFLPKYEKGKEGGMIEGGKKLKESLKEMFLKRFEDVKKKLAEYDKADPLTVEKHRVFFTGTLKSISLTDKKKTFNFSIKVQSIKMGEFDVSPFSRPTYQRKKFRGKSDVRSEIVEERNLSPAEKESLIKVLKKYGKIMAISQTEAETDEEFEQKRKEAIEDIEGTLELEGLEGLSIEDVKEIYDSIESRYSQMMEDETYRTTGTEYGYNERLSDIIESILDNYYQVKDDIERGG